MTEQEQEALETFMRHREAEDYETERYQQNLIQAALYGDEFALGQILEWYNNRLAEG